MRKLLLITVALLSASAFAGDYGFPAYACGDEPFGEKARFAEWSSCLETQRAAELEVLKQLVIDSGGEWKSEEGETRWYILSNGEGCDTACFDNLRGASDFLSKVHWGRALLLTVVKEDLAIVD